MAYNVLSIFSGAGGLDLGFENAGFSHLGLVELDNHCVATIKKNRPNWNVFHGDVHAFVPTHKNIDVLIGGPPCQGFSLGGNRNEDDVRNQLFFQMVRIAKATNPRVIVIENVLNLRTMKAPWSGKNFADEIASNFERLGYSVRHDVFKVSRYGVPQTRRRFIFIAVRGEFPENYEMPSPDDTEATIEACLKDISVTHKQIPNHDPKWGFQSRVHTNKKAISCNEIKKAVPVRISRTGSDGNPVRSFNAPFPAVDTATVWGWAVGHVNAERIVKDRENGKYIRNPNATVKLWRIEADEMRTFTHREYARLQTFPDEWVFLGKNKRDIHKQIGNAVPVEFARRVAVNILDILNAKDDLRAFCVTGHGQMSLGL